MCRIFGYLGDEDISANVLRRVSQLQIHGGPDNQTFTQANNWALGNNRLAIQGINGGSQPYNKDEKIHVVFNGEIYNHNQLRILLEHDGYFFKDTCDGSILPALYHKYGQDFVRYLDGMFAIAVIDTREGVQLTLATDPSGIKSLYYYWNNEDKTLKFSSELSPLLAFGKIKNEISATQVDSYFTGKAIWGNKTIYNEIYTLKPASILVMQYGQREKIYNYISLIDSEINCSNIEDAAYCLNQLLDNEVSSLMKADVPVCVVTSGGLDSSYISALASKYSNNLHSFNIWYEGEWPQDERHFAKEVADYSKTIHHQIIIAQNDFPGLIQNMLEHIGQPNSAPHALSTYALFKEIKNSGFKVALTGEGADEFFGGYARFSKANFDTQNDWLPSYLDKLSAIPKNLREEIYSDEYKNHLKTSDTLYDNTIKEITSREYKNKNRLKTLLEFDQIDRFPDYILRRVDHLSMANSLEVRVPFCQPRITSASRKLPNDFKVTHQQGKLILYKAARGKVPESILNRPKQPFLLPIASMLKKGHILYDLLIDTIHSQMFQSRNLFKKHAIETLIEKHATNPTDIYAESLWSLMILELWLKTTSNSLTV